MKKTIKLTEDKLVDLVKRVISEQQSSGSTTTNTESKCPDLGPEWTEACKNRCKPSHQTIINELLTRGKMMIASSENVSQLMRAPSLVVKDPSGKGCVFKASDISIKIS